MVVRRWLSDEMEFASVAMIFLNVFLVIVVPIIIGMAIFGALVAAYSLHIGVHVIYPVWVADYYPLLAKVFVLVFVFWCGDMIISIVLAATIDVVFVSMLLYVTILLIELVAQVISVCWYYFFDKSPSLSSKKGKWDLVTILRSYNNGYASKQFFPANIVDPVTQDPTHVFVFEMVRRTMSWKQVKVWNVSLNDQQVQVAPMSFDFVSFDNPFKRFWDLGPVYTFHSNDVLFALLKDSRIGVVASSPIKVLTDMRGGLSWSSSKILLIADLVHDKTVTVQLDDPDFQDILVSTSCPERLEENGQLSGWKVVFLTARMDREGHLYQPVLVKTVMDIKLNGDVHPDGSPQTKAVLGTFENEYPLRPIRTSDGLFGVIFIDDDEDDGTIMLYDSSNQVFVACSSLFELAELDNGFKKYDTSNHLSVDPSPVYLSQQQSIEVLRDGSVYRTNFPKPMVKRQAESIPALPEANQPPMDPVIE